MLIRSVGNQVKFRGFAQSFFNLTRQPRHIVTQWLEAIAHDAGECEAIAHDAGGGEAIHLH